MPIHPDGHEVTPMGIYRLVELTVMRCPTASEERAFRDVAKALGCSVRSVRERHRQVRTANIQRGLRCPTCAERHGA